jgi:type IX secretion system PorP/SprF family membrane protein
MRINKSFLRLFSLLVCMWANPDTYGQQKVQFTQYMFNTLVINPAYAGADEALSLTFINRDQWAGIENAPTTQSLSAHTLFRKQHSGVGLTLVHDKIGVHKNLNLMATYAFHIKTGPSSSLSLGLQAGLNNARSDYATLTGGAPNDPKLSNPLLSRTSLDFGTGIYFRSTRFHAGLSAPELLPGKVDLNDSTSIELSKSNWFYFSKYRVSFSDKIDAEPSILLKYLPGVPLSVDLNMNLIYRKVLTTGLSFRFRESIDFLLKAQITHQLQLGYSYDHSIGNVARISNGSHELMVHYLFRYLKTNVTSPR